jgi:hypothetical protein
LRIQRSRKLKVASATQAIANRKLAPIAKAWGHSRNFRSASGDESVGAAECGGEDHERADRETSQGWRRVKRRNA